MVTFGSDTTPNRRDWLLKAITVGVLVLSTTVAWLIVRRADASVDRGTDLVRQIRDKGLSHYWGPDRHVDWYLTYDAGENVVGWRFSARQRRSDGGFEGLHVARHEGRMSCEYWRINDHADDAYYYEAVQLPRTAGKPTMRTTTILLKDGKVTARHQPQNIVREGAAPDNYLPKGALELAYYLAASTGRTTVFNGVAPADGATQFHDLVVKDAEQAGDELQITLTKEFADDQGHSTTVLQFDKTGRRVGEITAVGWDILASRDMVASHSAAAITDVDTLLDRYGLAVENKADMKAMTERGAAVIAEIRQNGLDHYWGDESSIAWYLRTENTRVVGWRAVVRRRREGGEFEGLDVHYDNRRSDNGWEYWTVDGGATRGRYEAGRWKHVVGSAHLVRDINTKIILAEGRVKLWQKAHGQSEAPTPENYVPEGLLDLACYLAAGRKDKAQFALVFNTQPPDNGVTQFGRIRVDKAEALKNGPRVTIQTGKSLQKRKMRFDDNGRLVHWVSEERSKQGLTIHEERGALQATVVRAGKGFDQAPAYVSDILSQITASRRDDAEGGGGAEKTPGGDGADKTDGAAANGDS